MKKILYLFQLPLATISERPIHFFQWLLFSVGVGLLPLWYAMLRNLDDTASFDSLGLYFSQKGLTMFSIALLANGLSATFLAGKSGNSDEAIGIKAISNTACLILLLMNTGLLFIKPKTEILSSTNIFQILLFIFSILVASYIYCFRESKWEKLAGAFEQDDDRAKEELDNQASSVTADRNGVKV